MKIKYEIEAEVSELGQIYKTLLSFGFVIANALDEGKDPAIEVQQFLKKKPEQQPDETK